MRIFLDDERFPANNTGEWIIVRNSNEFHAAVVQCSPSFISFDHDLGDEMVHGSGMSIAKDLIEMDLDGKVTLQKDFDFQVHSMNPVGAENIEKLLRRYLRFKFQ